MALANFAVGVSFLNAVKDNSTSFFLRVTDYNGNVKTTSPVNYGASIQFSINASPPPPILMTAFEEAVEHSSANSESCDVI